MKKITLSLLLILTAMNSALAQKVTSILEIYDLETGTRTVVKEFPYTIEAPNWTVDGKWLIYNSKGTLHKISPDGKTEEELNTGYADRCGNYDVYTVPAEGGAEKRLTTAEGLDDGPGQQALRFCQLQAQLTFSRFQRNVGGISKKAKDIISLEAGSPDSGMHPSA